MPTLLDALAAVTTRTSQYHFPLLTAKVDTQAGFVLLCEDENFKFPSANT